MMAAAQSAQERPSAIQAAVGMLNYKQIQAELKLTPAQVQKINSLRDQTRKVMQSLQQSSTPPTKAQADSAGAKVRSLVDQAIAVLNTTQQTRLRQLAIQQFGIFAVVAKDVKGLVGITPDQEKRIRKVRDDADKKVSDLVQQRQLQLRSIPQPKNPNNKAEVEAYQKKVAQTAQSFESADKVTIGKWQKEAEAQALAVLTAAQKTKWQQVQGPKFDFSKVK